MFDVKAYQKQYRKDNPEQRKAGDKKYKEKHRKEISEYERLRRRSTASHLIVATEKLGRELDIKEVVHHIDINPSNNDPENLYIYKNLSEHQKGHMGLYKLVAELLKKNIIEFKNGEYKLK